MSDSHGNKDVMLKAIASESPDLILHLGDNYRDCFVIHQDYPDVPFRSVRGNGDFSAPLLDIDEFTFGDKRFCITHGHLFGVKIDLDTIIDFAISRGVNVLLFGHTHIPHYSVFRNISIINPGSIGLHIRTYAVLEIKNGELLCEHKNI